MPWSLENAVSSNAPASIQCAADDIPLPMKRRLYTLTEPQCRHATVLTSRLNGFAFDESFAPNQCGRIAFDASQENLTTCLTASRLHSRNLIGIKMRMPRHSKRGSGERTTE